MPKKRNASQAEHNEGMVVLHRSTFVDWQPKPIVSLASSYDGSLTAALRENGDVELYDSSTVHHLQRIAGHVEAVPTSIAVVDQRDDNPCRVFTAGLDGNILEIDYEHGGIAASSDSYGGAVWQLAVEPPSSDPTTDAKESSNSDAEKEKAESSSDSENDDSDDDLDEAPSAHSPLLAAACDDGCVRLFSIDLGVPGASYSRSLPKVEGRTLAVAWHPSKNFIVSGGSDACIHVWEVSTNREALRITANDATGSELCIWSLVVLSDGTIVSGDSGGNVCFWDGKFGTLIARFTQHAADILQLVASADGKTVFASGVDPKIAVFHRLKGNEWAFLSGKRAHTHDVRAMTVAGDVLYTGGNDTLLMAHSVEKFLKEHPTKVTTCPQRPIIHTAAQVRSQGDNKTESWLMAAVQNRVDVWRLGRPAADNASVVAGAAAIEGDGLPAESLPLHLARLVNKSGDLITAAAIAPNGQFVAYSDAHRMCCFSLTVVAASSPEAEAFGIPGMPKLELTKINVPEDIPAATNLFFVGDSSHLIATAADGTLRVLSLEGSDNNNKEATVLHTIRELHDLRYKMWFKRDRARSAARRAVPAIELACLSPDGRFLAACVRGRVHLLPLDGHKILASIPPPSEHVPITAIGFTPDSSIVATATAANQLSGYQIPSGAPSTWSEQHPPEALPRRVLSLPGPIVGIASSPSGPHSVLLFSSEAVCHVDFSAPVAAEPTGKKRRQREAAIKTATPAGENCRALYCSDPVLHVEALHGDQVVVVEKAWAEIYKELAPPMYRHRYGS